MPKRCWMAGLVVLTLVIGSRAAERVEVRDLHRAGALKLFERGRDLAQERSAKAWDFKDASTNLFTFYSPGIQAAAVSNGALRFRMASNSVMLGWGNYENRQPAAQRVPLWPGWNWIELTVRQSLAIESSWTLNLWQDGKSRLADQLNARAAATKKLTGTNVQVLSFLVQLPAPDGFDLTIAGEAGNAIEIQSLRILQKEITGCFRRDFTLPRGAIWLALAEVGKDSALYVNGQEVDFQRFNAYDFLTTSVNLAPYLKPGRKNCVALFSRQMADGRNLPGSGFVTVGYLQGQVVMSGGEVVRLDTPVDWKAAETAPAGWTETGYDDQGWQPTGTNRYYPPEDYQVRNWPVYDGRLILENPGADPQLFFDAGQPLKVRVRVPEGLAAEKPVLKWVLRAAADEPRTNSPEPEIAAGTVVEFATRGKTDSLVYEIDAGLRPRGVYTLEVSLHAGGSVIEKRAREPLIIVGKIPMPEVKGTNCLEGLNLVLEDTIDFTNPADPHPWVEAESQKTKEIVGVTNAAIVRKNGLVYRETKPGAGSGVVAHFSYQCAFQRPRSCYLLVLEYPDDASRCIGVTLEAIDVWDKRDPKITRSSKSGPAVITGYKHPVTGKMQELRWFHYPDSREQVLDVAALANGTTAAAARLRIYRIEGELPAIAIKASGERWLGLHTERARTVAALYGPEDPGDYQLALFDQRGLDMVGVATQRLKWFFEGCENYTRYLRFSGQNLHVMGAYQYYENNTAYFPPSPAASSRIQPNDIRDVALRVFDRNGVAMLSMIEYCVHQFVAKKYDVNDAQVAAGADTLFPVDKNGKQARSANCVSQANFDHPVVQQWYLNVIDDLGAKYSFCPSWKGVFLMAFPAFSGPVAYAPLNRPLDYDYSDATIAAFKSATGITVPVDAKDPKRFEKRYAFLTSDAMRAKWIDWRCRTVHDLVVKSRDVLLKHRKDLQLMYGYYYNADYLVNWYKSGRPYLEAMRDCGWDPTLFAKDPGIWTGRYFYPNGGSMGMLWGKYGYGIVWEQEVGLEALAAFDRPTGRLAVLNTCWHEVEFFAPGSTHVWTGSESKITYATNWPVAQAHVRYVSQPGGDNARENFTQALIGSDPDVIMYGFTDAMFPMGYEQQLRDVARVLLPLPGDRFQPVLGTTDFRHNLAIRDLRKGADYWFTVANPGYWPIQGEVVLSGSARLVDPATDEAIPTKEAAGRTIVPIDLRGYGMAAFKANEVGGLPVEAAREAQAKPGQKSALSQSKIEVVSWTNTPVPAEYLKYVQALMAEVEGLMADADVAAALNLEERAFVKNSLASAVAALAAGEIARAWSLLTDARFWTLVNDHLKQAVKYAAGIPGYEPQVRNPDQLPLLNVARAEQPPVIDGQLAEAFWRQAPRTEGFVSQTAQGILLGRPLVTTAVQAAYDSQNLYLGFTLAERHLDRLQSQAVDPPEVLTAYDDAMVILLHPDGTKMFQMAVNPAGLKYNADATGKTSGYFRKHDADFGPWQAAVSQGAKVWTIEVAIPYATLKTTAPKAGDQWQANFLRRYRKFEVPEMYWALIKTSWYETDCYGRLRFL